MLGAGPLVGRDSSLVAVAAAVAAAAVGRPSIVLVSGEAGIGKTALMSEAASRAAGAGARVLWGQCWHGAGTPAFWPWIQIVRAAIPQLPYDIGPDLARLLDPPDGGRRVAQESPTARFELFDAVTQLLATPAGKGPTLVVIDDLQWADEESLALVEFVARHLSASPVVLLGAYRDLEAPPVLGQLARLAERVRLTGLDGPGVEAVIANVSGTTPGIGVAARIRERTGGNPLFVRELTRLLMAQGRLTEAAGGLPVRLDSVHDTLRQRLSRMPPACEEVLQAVAVAGPEVRLAMLRGLVADPQELPRLVSELVAANLLVNCPPAVDVYRFSHELFRETVYATLPPLGLSRAHEACGRVLEAMADAGAPIHAAEIANHFLAASGDSVRAAAAAVAWSQRAAEEAIARLAAADAVRHYQRALSAVGAGGTGLEDHRIALTLGLAQAQDRAGQPEAARAAYLHVISLATNRKDPESHARAAIGIHDLGAPTGQSHAEQIALLQESAAALAGTNSPLRALVLADLARDLHHSWEHEHQSRAVTLADQAAGLARASGDKSVLARCLLARHDTQWRPGSAHQRLAIITEIMQLGIHSGNRELRTLALLLRATARLELGDPAGYQDLAEHCDESDRAGHARAKWQALSRRATLALIDGDIARAGALSTQAAELGERIGEPDWSSVADGQLWETLRFTTGRGRYADIGHSGALLASWPPWPAIGLADDGEPDKATELLTAFDLDRGFRPGPRTNPEAWSSAIVAEAVAAAGTTAQRQEMYRRLTPLTGTHVVTGGCAAYSGAIDHYLGLLAAALGDTTLAATHFADAITMHERLGASRWAALSRTQRARLTDPRSNQDPAPPILASQGATWMLSYLGHHVHLPDQRGLHDLATLIANPGQPIHVLQLLTGQPPAAITTLADPILDDHARAAFRKRLHQLDTEIDDATLMNDLHRAERATLEREAILHELTSAAGLGGRPRRLGDDTERARKTVTPRIRDTIKRIRQQGPALADHLDARVTTGAWCCYATTNPARPDTGHAVTDRTTAERGR